MKTLKTVFAGLSGGVDSSVAALRLKKSGYNVVGVFIKVWHPDFMVCNWEEERLDAMRVAAHLDIPFLTCDAEAAYKNEVAEYFISEYKAGRTPNPDVLCNQEVKFGAFLRFAMERGADFIATGHYVRRVEVASGPELHRGLDINKDQSYFLWSLSDNQLSKALFPVGDSEKLVIRKEAFDAGIPTATKKDSQGICFLGHIDIPEFLSHYTTLTPGAVLDTEGVVIGEHKGALVYTVGQRHGFTLTNHDTKRPQHYVLNKNVMANTITVGEHPPLVPKETTIRLESVTLRANVKSGDLLTAQFRYRQTPFAILIEEKNETNLLIRPLDEVEQPASGQSCVIYRDSLCLGGGIVA